MKFSLIFCLLVSMLATPDNDKMPKASAPKETICYYFWGLTTNNTGKQTFFHTRVYGPENISNPSSYLETRLANWRKSLPTTYVNTDSNYGSDKKSLKGSLRRLLTIIIDKEFLFHRATNYLFVMSEPLAN